MIGVPQRCSRGDDRRARISVVLVNWNTQDRLLAALATFTSATPSIVDRVVVVDNHSSDGSAEAAAKVLAGSSAQLVANSENRGYAAAVNQGVAGVTAPYVLIANADVQCPSAAAAAMAGFLDEHPRAAAVGPALLNRDGSRQLSWGKDPHFVSEFVQRWWWRRLEIQRRLAQYAAQPRPVDWVLGACFMIRREAFEQVGRMEESYFMYFEEVDLCTRLRRAGWDVWYLPTVSARHEGQASTAQRPEAMALAYRRSQLQYYGRFHGAWAAGILRGYLWVKLVWHARGREVLKGLSASPPP